MALIVFLFPSSAPVRELRALTTGQHYSSLQQYDREQFLYNIVLDAGSTGSRIHIFKFSKQGSHLQLITDGFHQLKPGLSAYPDEPQKAANSLKPLMDEALKAVPEAQQVSCVCWLG